MTWRAPHAGRGVPPVFPSAAIQFCLSVRVRSKLALRQTAGMVVSLLRLAGPAWPVPVTLSGACSLANGEWHARKPGVQGGPRARGRSGGGDRHVRYPRRPIHLQPRRPLSWFEDKHCRVRDSPVLPELPEQIPESEERGTVTADSACDIRRCHTAIIARQASAVIPIRKNGRPCKEDCPAARARNETLRAPRHSGRAGPEAHDRMPCPQPDQSQDARLQGLRRTHRRKDPDRQTEEICIRIALLNRFNAQGTAEIVRLD
tara:strand:- start:5105 stop:5884 length:780 start_codon:yes stop_codon:yes gene_type:complete